MRSRRLTIMRAMARSRARRAWLQAEHRRHRRDFSMILNTTTTITMKAPQTTTIAVNHRFRPIEVSTTD